MKKFIALFITALVALGTLSVSVSAADKSGWAKEENGSSYYYPTEGGEPVKGNIYKIDGVMYVFDKDGVCEGTYNGITSIKNSSPAIIYGYIDGVRASGLRAINGKKYYFNPETGIAMSGSVALNGRQYIFDSNCVFTGRITGTPIKVLLDKESYNFKSDKGITVTAENISESSIVADGIYFNLQKKTDKGFETVDDFYLADVLVETLPAGESEDAIFPFASYKYKHLTAGTYRIEFHSVFGIAVCCSKEFKITE